MAAFRSTRHDSTSFLLFGRKVRAPVDLALDTGEAPGDEQTNDDYVESARDRYVEACGLSVCRHLNEAALRNNRYYDLRVKPPQYDVGD